MPTKIINTVDLDKEFRKRKRQVYALAGFYAAEALRYFQNEQLSKVVGKWWTNRTFQAASRFFAKAFKASDADEATIGFFISHGVDYGKYLTIANDRKHDALTPIVNKFGPKFLKDVQSLYKD